MRLPTREIHLRHDVLRTLAAGGRAGAWSTVTDLQKAHDFIDRELLWQVLA